MNSNYYCSEYPYQNHPQQDAEQSGDVSMSSSQKQTQTLIIKKCHGITINQQKAQALIAIEVSLQAAIEAIIAAFDAQDEIDTTDLQQLVQQLKVLQFQKEIIAIECSGDITIKQQQIQVEAVVQAVIQLLAKISAKIIDA
ncbi:MAG: spore coat protein [Turicibacter sp.]|nr:spore coat protein [Turicibacter sp.]